MMFDGKKLRDKILAELKTRIEKLKNKPTLAVVWAGEDFATARYIESKSRVAEHLGVRFNLIKYPDTVDANVIRNKIEELNKDDQITGIMIQLPLPKNIDQIGLIELIDKNKDVDALRFCAHLTCAFRPPTVLAIFETLKELKINIKNKIVAIVGKGFLVGAPLVRVLTGEVADLRVADETTPYIGTITLDADIVISAVGKAGLIKSAFIKKGVVLIDAGTSESGGSLAGDINPKAYTKASDYTPVPGGIGPVTIAMLMRNLVEAAERNLE